MGQRGGVVAHVVLVPVALVVVMARQLIEHLALVGQLTHLELEDAGPLTVDQEHDESLERFDHRLELLHAGSLVDDQLIPYRDRQLDHLPKAAIRTAEDGQATSMGPVDARLDVRLDAPQVLVRRVAVEVLLSVAQQMVELHLVVAGAHVTATVDVEVEADHRGA